MTLTKRVLCAALSILLGMALLAPGVMAEDDPNAPVIIKQPSLTRWIRSRRTLALEVQAKLPDGIQGELSVAWYVSDQAEPIATGAKTSISTSSLGGYTGLGQYVPGGSFDIYAVVTNTYTDSGGQMQTASIESDTSTVDIFISPLDTMELFWNATWAGGFFPGLLAIPLNVFLALRIMTASAVEYYLALILG